MIGFTTWTDGRDAFTDTWLELVSTVVPDDLLGPTLRQGDPEPRRFTQRAAVEEVLLDAGLRHVRTEPSAVPSGVYGRDEYVDGLSVWATGRFVREMLGDDGWASFRSACARRSPIASPIRCTTAATSCSRSAPRSSELAQVEDAELLGERGADLLAGRHASLPAPRPRSGSPR